MITIALVYYLRIMNMEFLATELAIINIALNRNPDGQGRTFAVDKLQEVSEISKKLEGNTKEDENGELVFVDGEVDFTSAENVLLESFIKELKWSSAQAKTVLGALKRLN